MSIYDINLTIPESKRESFESAFQRVYTYTFNYKYVPSSFVKDLLKIMMNNKFIAADEIRKKAIKSSNIIVQLIKKYPDYDLNWRIKSLEKTEERDLELQNFAQLMLFAFFHFESEKKRCEFSQVVKFFYDAFKTVVYSEKLKPEEELSRYKLLAIVGFFTLAAGYLQINPSRFTPNQSFLRVKHQISKIDESSK